MKTKAKKHLRSFLHSLSFKLFLVLLILLVVLFSLYVTIGSRLQMQMLEDTVKLGAYRQSDMIKKSLYRLMLVNKRDELYHTILLMGEEPGVESIRIYNKKGEIKFSTKESETGHTVDMKAEACYDCHAANQPIQALPMQERTRIYRAADNRRIMGMINPIRNAPACSNAACHAHQTDQTILGVLDVQMSLNALDEAMFKTKSIIYLIFFVIILLATILVAMVVYLIIYRPIRNLQIGTTTLAEGNLDHRIKMQRKDELGTLAGSFNNMASNLKTAQTELKNWSILLEKRVEDKTAELERIHQGMLQVEKMASLGKMAASAAHELNNPLAGIVTYAKLLIKKMQNNPTEDIDKDNIVEKLELIRSESMRCGNIVRNLLAFARGTVANFQECVINEIIDRAFRIVNHHIELAKIEVVSRIEIQTEKIICDPDQLLQAFIALLVNAVEAMPDGGRLKIHAHNSHNDAKYVLIEISDTGPGIPEDLKDKIFEPFFSTKKDKSGVGLGLAVVYGIIQRHKGKIWMESQEKAGTTFFIELPLTQPDNEKKDSSE